MSQAAATSALISLSVGDKDGAKYLAPVADVNIGILDAMIATQNERGQISWVEITESFVKGELVATGARVVIYRSDLDNATDEALSDWVTA